MAFHSAIASLQLSGHRASARPALTLACPLPSVSKHGSRLAHCSHPICYIDIYRPYSCDGLCYSRAWETGACPEPNAHRELHGSGRAFLSSCLQGPGSALQHLKLAEPQMSLQSITALVREGGPDSHSIRASSERRKQESCIA